MKTESFCVFAVSLLVMCTAAFAQTPTEMDSHIAAAKAAGGWTSAVLSSIFACPALRREDRAAALDAEPPLRLVRRVVRQLRRLRPIEQAGMHLLTRCSTICIG